MPSALLEQHVCRICGGNWRKSRLHGFLPLPALTQPRSPSSFPVLPVLLRSGDGRVGDRGATYGTI
ncbi:hypothetical protein IQ268_18400 [Oculatella sp. LEGE 06141]|uniref:hypothetical protein n=1 Tax=Oculatella sp. LEGE 06141 TaxID=1828648 RepID=UPI00187EC2A4|nr:hypothetical protein [Oculatella sp. LEGE 06141]MBE9180535.1 hypothetical protein [Oculatella sp. LEGE 06141]